jgi:RTC4-like domain
MVILHTLVGMFKSNTTPRRAIAPFNLAKFMDFVLVPYVALHLIAEDLKCSIKTAYKEMCNSGYTGEILHPEPLDDDDEMDDIFRRNVKEARKKQQDAENNGVVVTRKPPQVSAL